MPLSFPVKQPNITITRIKNTFLQIVNYIRPDFLLSILLLVAIILAFLQIQAWGFYSICSIFIISYFTERIFRILQRRPE